VTDDSGMVAVVDKRGQARVLSGPYAEAGGLAWSPDGSEVWFTAAREGLLQALHAVSLSGRERTLLRGAGSLYLRDVFADGRALLVHARPRWEIAGLFPGDTAEHDYSWLDGTIVADLSSDGGTIAFQEIGIGGGRGGTGYLRRTDGSNPIRLGEGDPMALSADGRFVLSYYDGAGSRQLLLVPTGPGETRVLPRGTIDKYVWGQFFPDGRRVYLLGNEAGRPLRCFVQDLPDGVPRAFTPEGTHPPGL
jgi:hypothetical protein